MANIELRQIIAEKRLRFYEIADKIGISPFTFSVWMRTELTTKRRQKVEAAIEALTT